VFRGCLGWYRGGLWWNRGVWRVFIAGLGDLVTLHIGHLYRVFRGGLGSCMGV